MKKTIRLITPPFIINAARGAFRRRPAESELFDGSDEAFKQAASASKVYGEYGCGASTRWMASNTKATIYAVDTAQSWINSVVDKVGAREHMSLHWVDVGPIGNWGKPTSYSKSDNFSTYTNWIWQREQTPDLVLIDGRFRVCCFATSLKHAAEGSTIIFDDYTNRMHYKIVEQLIKPTSICGRQALFEVPPRKRVDMDAVDRMINNFRFVID